MVTESFRDGEVKLYTRGDENSYTSIRMPGGERLQERLKLIKANSTLGAKTLG